MYPHDPLRRTPIEIRREKGVKVEVWILCMQSSIVGIARIDI
jgi:hypothetical protein